MEKYGDEGFIRLLRQRQEDARNKDIQKGPVWVNGEELIFKEREILKNQLWMWMPDEFTILSKELARIKYPNESRPDIIYTSPETTVNVNFSHKRETMKTGQEEELRDYMEQIIHNLYPTTDTIDKQSAAAGERLVAWFDFITPAIDGEVYNLMFYTTLKGRLLIGSCNCLGADQEDWKEYFIQMIQTIRTV